MKTDLQSSMQIPTEYPVFAEGDGAGAGDGNGGGSGSGSDGSGTGDGGSGSNGQSFDDFLKMEIRQSLTAE